MGPARRRRPCGGPYTRRSSLGVRLTRSPRGVIRLVMGLVAEGVTADMLLREAKGADLLVVGSRGHGGFASALLGSVSMYCVLHAHCPVLVLRDGLVTPTVTSPPAARN